MVNEHAFFVLEVPAHDCEILPYRRVFEKLANQGLAVRPSFGKQEDSGGVAIDAMDDEGALPLMF